METVELVEAIERSNIVIDNNLLPEKYFAGKLRITQADEVCFDSSEISNIFKGNYSNDLLSFFSNLPLPAQKDVVERLSDPIPAQKTKVTTDGVLSLISTLYRQRISPSLLVHFKLQEMKDITKDIVNTLEKEQANSKKISVVTEEKKNDWEKKEAKEESDSKSLRDMAYDIEGMIYG